MKINSDEIRHQKSKVTMIKYFNIKNEKCHDVCVYKEFSAYLKGRQKA
jgi:hypothetical protein